MWKCCLQHLHHFFSGLNIREGNKMSEWLWVQDLVNSVCKHPRSCITPGPYIICKDTTHHDPSVSEWTLYNKSSIPRTTYTSTVSHDLDQERSLRNWILNTNFTHNINTTAVWKKIYGYKNWNLFCYFVNETCLKVNIVKGLKPGEKDHDRVLVLQTCTVLGITHVTNFTLLQHQ